MNGITVSKFHSRAFAVFAVSLLTICALTWVMTSEDSEASGTITVGTGQSVTIDVSEYLTSSQLAEFNDPDFEQNITASVKNIYNQGTSWLACSQISDNIWKIQASTSTKAGTYTLEYNIISIEFGDELTVATSPLIISDGTGQGTQSSPLQSVNYVFSSVPSSVSDYGDYHTETLYVMEGASVRYKLNMASYDPTVSVTPRGSTGTSQSYGGISVSIDSSHNATFSGTMGNQALTMNWKYGAREINTTLIPVSGDIPVTSVSISGSSVVDKGSTITLTASIGPSDATDKSVSWSIQSGSSYVSISTSGSNCVVTGKAIGTAVIKCIANDGSGKYATKTINVNGKFILSYDANGGSGEPSDVTYSRFSSSYSAEISSIQPTKSGYTFLGWSKSSTATSATYQPGGSITLSEGTTTLYAVWEVSSGAVDRGTISNGDTIRIFVNETSMLTITVAVNAGAYMSPISGEDWVTYDTGRGTGIVTAQPMETGIFEFTVHLWIPGMPDSMDVSYTLEVVEDESAEQKWFAYLYYNANGGTGAPSTQSDSISAPKASGSKTFTIPSTKPTKSGFDFLGWSTSSTATSASYQPGSTISVAYDSSKTLYAVWKENTFTSTLYFNANGGTGAPSSLTYKGTSTSAHTFTIPSKVPTKTGFVFLGWSENSTATTASYQPNGTISVSYNGSKTLYAVWQTAQLDITSEPVMKSLKVGQSWSYTPTTNISGCTVTVSGADWLSVTNGKISGTPTTSGTYNVTVTISKNGYVSDSQSFVLKVYSSLGFNSLPGASGMFAFAE